MTSRDSFLQRKVTILRSVILILISLLSAPGVWPQQPVNKPRLASEVRAEFMHAWNGYKKYAWGHDDLKPLSKTYHDWYAEPLLMTPVDALDTMILMGLKVEANRTRQYIVKNLSFDKNIEVQNFEITIRMLGGFLSSYQLTGDRRLLNLAEDLGNRLLPVFESPTGLPYRYVNLKTGQWTDTDSHISGAIDSYYEYLLKCAILFDDQDCRKMWTDSLASINQYLRDETKGRMKPELWYGHADMNTGKRTATTYGALDAFFPAVLALSGDLDRAKRLQASSFKMWSLHGIEPEELDYNAMQVVSPGYPLRPEIVESTYYLYHYTKDPRYVRKGEELWRDFVKY